MTETDDGKLEERCYHVFVDTPRRLNKCTIWRMLKVPRKSTDSVKKLATDPSCQANMLHSCDPVTASEHPASPNTCLYLGQDKMFRLRGPW